MLAIRKNDYFRSYEIILLVYIFWHNADILYGYTEVKLMAIYVVSDLHGQFDT